MADQNFSRPEPQDGFNETDWQEYQDWLDAHGEDDLEIDQFRDDVEADADALRSAGWGVDEDYNSGYYDDYYEME